MIQTLSENVIVPIAGLVITYVLCYELILSLIHISTDKYFAEQAAMNSYPLFVCGQMVLLESPALAAALSALSPVSYTHLDVYKRQLLDEWKEKQPPELAQPDRKKDWEK